MILAGAEIERFLDHDPSFCLPRDLLFSLIITRRLVNCQEAGGERSGVEHSHMSTAVSQISPVLGRIAGLSRPYSG